MVGSRDPLFMEEYKRWQRINIENTVTMLRSVRNLYGENAIRVATAAYASLIRQRWRDLSKDRKDLSIEALFGLLWEESKNLISYEIVKKDTKSLTLRVDSCFWADEFKRIKATDIGYELCCITDFYIADTFNPAIMYKQGKTIMRGDDYCTHSYAMGK